MMTKIKYVELTQVQKLSHKVLKAYTVYHEYEPEDGFMVGKIEWKTYVVYLGRDPLYHCLSALEHIKHW